MDTTPGRSASQTAIATTTAILMKSQSARQKVMTSLRRAVCRRRHQLGRDRIERIARLILGEPRSGLSQPTGGSLRGASGNALDFTDRGGEIAVLQLRFAAREVGERPVALGIGADRAHRDRLRKSVDQALRPA